jgi:hypothetical protein
MFCLQVSSGNKNYSVKVPSELTSEELKNWLKAVCGGVGCCVGMIEIDTGDAAGRPCSLCGESTSNNITSATKRPKSVSMFFTSYMYSYIQIQ